MKKYLLGTAFAIASIMSCTNEAIEIDSVKAPEPIYYNTLTITVDPTDLFSSYTYEDTYHNVAPLKQAFQTFNSEEKRFIQWRTLIYNKDEQLVDSVVDYLSNLNSLTRELELRGGDYYAITTLTFTDTLKNSMWNLLDKEKMSTVKLKPKGSFEQWYVMSQSSQEFAISKDVPARVVSVPKPVGCIVYSFWENFSKWDLIAYGDSLDQVQLHTKDITDSYNLDPHATNRFNMLDELKHNQWYSLDYCPGVIFEIRKAYGDDDSWRSYRYIFNTDKATRLLYGYSLKGKDGFWGVGDDFEFKTEPGKTYLSYWNYDYIGNPYFGVADNDHWNRK